MKNRTLASKVIAATLMAALMLAAGAWTDGSLALAHGKETKDKKTESPLPLKTVTVSAENGAVVAGPVTIQFTSGSGSVLLNGKKLKQSTTTVQRDGIYRVVLKDGKGKVVSAQSFTIDKSKPAILIKSSYRFIRDGGVSKSPMKVTVRDLTTVTITVQKDGQAIDFGKGVFAEEGQYTVTATDKLGNQATLTFKIDRKAPVITVTDSAGAQVANKATVAGPVKVQATDLTLKKVYLGSDKKKADLPADGVLSTPGKYCITAVDAVGRTTTFKITIQ